MRSTKKSRARRDKAKNYRARMRARGLRPIQVWVPDTRTPKFRMEAHRQSLAVGSSAQARDDQAFIDAVSTSNDV